MFHTEFHQQATKLALDINQQDINGNTPLHLAASNSAQDKSEIKLDDEDDTKYFGQPDFIQIEKLLANGADPLICNHQSKQPFEMLIRKDTVYASEIVNSIRSDQRDDVEYMCRYFLLILKYCPTKENIRTHFLSFLYAHFALIEYKEYEDIESIGWDESHSMYPYHFDPTLLRTSTIKLLLQCSEEIIKSKINDDDSDQYSDENSDKQLNIIREIKQSTELSEHHLKLLDDKDLYLCHAIDIAKKAALKLRKILKKREQFGDIRDTIALLLEEKNRRTILRSIILVSEYFNIFEHLLSLLHQLPIPESVRHDLQELAKTYQSSIQTLDLLKAIPDRLDENEASEAKFIFEQLELNLTYREQYQDLSKAYSEEVWLAPCKKEHQQKFSHVMYQIGFYQQRTSAGSSMLQALRSEKRADAAENRRNNK